MRLHATIVFLSVGLGGCAAASGVAPDASGVAPDGDGSGGGVDASDRDGPPSRDADPCADTVWYADEDGDGHGNPGAATSGCDAPAGHVATAGDCDDGDPLVYPGRAELCDGLDNDCEESTPEACPAECVPQARPETGRRYLFCNGDSNWTTAQATCAGQAMRLVRIDDATENAWVRATANTVLGSNQDAWIGANDRATENVWAWDDGTQFWEGSGNGTAVGGLFARWDPGEPNDDGTEDCAEQQTDGEWNDIPCGDANEFVCERY